ncbi:methylated-DNA--[protein]-cysteine S-methyltransferase [Marinobacterium jannaschii]|uniref:methylated-DNA--[protein]-cysteine S-methyltransferase n=1 Tax=Marinobacterium jannaschii TaxID=64970 RepID=UPI000564DF12|nr:methylated-DNA--[protein]-cysteine S-methyltransferase [Marinobacterium jannaschii]
MISIQYYKSPCGELLLGAYDNQLCLCDWRYRKQRAQVDRRLQNYLKADYIEQGAGVIEQAIGQLEQYFCQQRTRFDIPLLFAGTDFQQAVWQALVAIPYGELASYGELARRLERPDAVRAVASANGANALSIFVPCHRIVGSNGALTGYAGGLAAKQKLLTLEQSGQGVLF